MKRLLNIAKDLAGLLVLGALTIGLVLIFRSQQDRSGGSVLQSPIQTPTSLRLTMTVLLVPHTPTVQPPGQTPIAGPGTPTPNNSQFGTPPAIPAPSVTSLPISRTTDLAPELSEANKAKVYVQHADSSYQVFLIRYDMDTSQLPLQPGDKIIQIVPPKSLMGTRAPRPTVYSPLATPTNVPPPAPTISIVAPTGTALP